MNDKIAKALGDLFLSNLMLEQQNDALRLEVKQLREELERGGQSPEVKDVE